MAVCGRQCKFCGFRGFGGGAPMGGLGGRSPPGGLGAEPPLRLRIREAVDVPLSLNLNKWTPRVNQCWPLFIITKVKVYTWYYRCWGEKRIKRGVPPKHSRWSMPYFSVLYLLLEFIRCKASNRLYFVSKYSCVKFYYFDFC